MCAATREVCAALQMLLHVLLRLGFTTPFDLDFTPLSRRWEQRFAVFGTLLRPPLLTMAQYVDRCQDKMGAESVAVMAAAALAHFKAAKAAVDKALHSPDSPATPEQRADLTALARVAVANSVMLASALTPPPAEGSRRATFDFGTHKCFPIVKLVEAKPPR